MRTGATRSFPIRISRSASRIATATGGRTSPPIFRRRTVCRGPADDRSAQSADYVIRSAILLRTLLVGVETIRLRRSGTQSGGDDLASPGAIVEKAASLLRYGFLATAAAAVEALAVVEAGLKMGSKLPAGVVLRLLEAVAANIKGRVENGSAADDEVRRRWEIIDLVLAILVGVVRFGMLTDPRGLDAINDYDCREWLRMNGASEHALNSAFLRGLYDLVFAYEGGDPNRPRLAAGDALRSGFRMFFTYRGAFFWKMRRGMGDVVFAPVLPGPPAARRQVQVLPSPRERQALRAPGRGRAASALMWRRSSSACRRRCAAVGTISL